MLPGMCACVRHVGPCIYLRHLSCPTSCRFLGLLSNSSGTVLYYLRTFMGVQSLSLAPFCGRISFVSNPKCPLAALGYCTVPAGSCLLLHFQAGIPCVGW